MLRHVDLIEIFILLFADDVILMSDSVCGLQNQLNIFYETANHLGLVVNLDKSNIVVFRNGGYNAWNEKWFYGQSLISLVNAYNYFVYQVKKRSVCLSTRLTFSRVLKNMAARAKIGVVNTLKLLWSLGENLLRFSSNCSMYKFYQFSIIGLKSGVWRPT